VNGIPDSHTGNIKELCQLPDTPSAFRQAVISGFDSGIPVLNGDLLLGETFGVHVKKHKLFLDVCQYP